MLLSCAFPACPQHQHGLELQSYDANIVFKGEPALPTSPTTHKMQLGETYIFAIDAFVTEPSGDFEFGIFQPLGYTV